MLGLGVRGDFGGTDRDRDWVGLGRGFCWRFSWRRFVGLSFFFLGAMVFSFFLSLSFSFSFMSLGAQGF